MTHCATLATLYPETCELIIPSCFAVATADYVFAANYLLACAYLLAAFLAALPICTHVETLLQ